MDRFRRVAQWWNWLPAFRAVAEHESIHDAAIVLAVSPSALSRTVRLLEDSVGRTLFVRNANSITLTPFGRDLLTATRDSMRIIDDCAQRAEAADNRPQPVTILTTSPIAAAALAAALTHLPSSHRTGALVLGELDEAQIVESLLRGDTDMVISGGDASDPTLQIDALGDVSLGVYAHESHPFAAKKDSVTVHDLGSARFVTRAPDDGWPESASREVSASNASLEATLLLCRRGLLCVLPDVFVHSLGAASGLVRLCEASPARALFAIRRRPLAGQDAKPLDAIMTAARVALAVPDAPNVPAAPALIETDAAALPTARD